MGPIFHGLRVWIQEMDIARDSDIVERAKSKVPVERKKWEMGSGV